MWSCPVEEPCECTVERAGSQGLVNDIHDWDDHGEVGVLMREEESGIIKYLGGGWKIPLPPGTLPLPKGKGR